MKMHDQYMVQGLQEYELRWIYYSISRGQHDREAMKVVNNPDGSGYKIITFDYPVKLDTDLAYIYSTQKSNSNMDRMSSLGLRKKLEKEGLFSV